MEKDEKEKKSRSGLILLVIVIIAACITVPWGLMTRDRVAGEIVESKNQCAETCYKVITTKTDLESRLTEDEIMINGEINGFKSVKLNPGPFGDYWEQLTEERDDANEKTYFWYARCCQGKIQELWISDGPANTAQIHSCTVREQKKQTGFFGNIGENVIGYYSP